MTRSVLRMARRFGITGTSEIFRAFILAADPRVGCFFEESRSLPGGLWRELRVHPLAP